MSYSVSDSIAGKPIDIVYGAAQLALPCNAAREQRNKVVRQHLASNRARFALVVRNDTETEIWWVGDTAGVSFAAAIEHWLEEMVERPQSLQVIIPLDISIYIAMVEDNLIMEERILPIEIAEQELRESQSKGQVIHAFAGGTMQQMIERQIVLQPLPFDPLQYEYTPAWKVFAKQAMLHPTHVIAATGLFLIITIFTASGSYIEQSVRSGWNLLIQHLPFVEVTDALIKNVPPQIITPEVDHSAAWQMRSLASLLASAEKLYRDGLTNLTYAAGGVTLSGISEYPFPNVARLYALDNQSTWAYTSGGWTITQSVSVHADSRIPTLDAEHGIQRLLESKAGLTLISGPEAIVGAEDEQNNTVTQPLSRTTYQVILNNTAIGGLLERAEHLDDLPIALLGATCIFANWQINDCQLTFEVMTL